MKKTLFFITIIALVLAFSGCDPLLEGFFPQYGDQGGVPEKDIEISLDLDWNASWYNDYTNWIAPVVIRVWAETSPGNFELLEEPRLRYWSVGSFIWDMIRLPVGTYQIQAFYDKYSPFDVQDTTEPWIYLEKDTNGDGWGDTDIIEVTEDPDDWVFVKGYLL